MNPYELIGALVAIIAVGLGAFAYGGHVGRTSERALWQLRENTELRSANAAIHALEEGARAIEVAHLATLARIDKQHTQEIEDARLQKDRDVAAARAGRIVLRIPTACKPAGGDPRAGAAPGPGVDHGGTSSELPREVAADLLGLADDADAVVRQLTACQAVVREDRAKALSP